MALWPIQLTDILLMYICCSARHHVVGTYGYSSIRCRFAVKFWLPVTFVIDAANPTQRGIRLCYPGRVAQREKASVKRRLATLSQHLAEWANYINASKSLSEQVAQSWKVKDKLRKNDFLPMSKHGSTTLVLPSATQHIYFSDTSLHHDGWSTIYWLHSSETLKSRDRACCLDLWLYYKVNLKHILGNCKLNIAATHHSLISPTALKQ